MTYAKGRDNRWHIVDPREPDHSLCTDPLPPVKRKRLVQRTDICDKCRLALEKTARVE